MQKIYIYYDASKYCTVALLQIKIIWQFDKGMAFIPSFPTIEINNRKSQK